VVHFAYVKIKVDLILIRRRWPLYPVTRLTPGLSWLRLPGGHPFHLAQLKLLATAEKDQRVIHLASFDPAPEVLRLRLATRAPDRVTKQSKKACEGDGFLGAKDLLPGCEKKTAVCLTLWVVHSDAVGHRFRWQ